MNVLVTLATTWNLPSLFIIHFSTASHVVWTSEVSYLHLPHVLLPHGLIDLIVQVTDHEVAETGVLDLADFARDLLEDLATPFLAGGNGHDLRDHLWAARSSNIDNSEFCSLGLAETEEHGLSLF